MTQENTQPTKPASQPPQGEPQPRERLTWELLSPAWCYDENGQQFAYIPAEIGKQAAEAISALTRQLAESRQDLEKVDKFVRSLGFTHFDDLVRAMGCGRVLDKAPPVPQWPANRKLKNGTRVKHLPSGKIATIDGVLSNCPGTYCLDFGDGTVGVFGDESNLEVTQ